MSNFDRNETFDIRTQIVVKSIPSFLSENGFRHLFGNFGEVKRVHVGKTKPNQNQTLRSALVIYQDVESVEKAIGFLDQFKIGSDGPKLRVTKAKTQAEKLDMKRQRAVEQKLLDEVYRMPGFSKEPIRYDSKWSQNQAAGDTIDDEQLSICDRQMFTVDGSYPGELIVLESSADLAQIASDMNLLKLCRKCRKESSSFCCESAWYCGIQCQEADRSDHSKECDAWIMKEAT